MASPEEHAEARRVLAVREPDLDDEDEVSPFDVLKLEDPRYLREQARLYTPSAMDAIKEIMEDPSQPGATRKSCAELLLAYGWGKPSSQVEITRLFLDAEQEGKTILFEMPMTVDGVKDDDSDGKARTGDLG
jgi:hypothetical protein